MFSKPQSEIMQHWGDNKIPLVSICCTTYNHENYIEQAIKGFLIQETTFPFEILIRDDCSNDNTASIIKKYQKLYPKLIFPVYEKENQYPKGVKPMPVLYKKAKGEFIALCEGDDYWIDPRKIEKQVSFLKNNLLYSMCATRYNLVGNPKEVFSSPGEHSLENIIHGNKFGTLTVIFRTKYLSTILYSFLNSMPTGDWPLWIYLSSKGKTKIIHDITASYRIHEGGIYGKKDPIFQHMIIFKILKKMVAYQDTLKINIKVLEKSWKLNIYRSFKKQLFDELIFKETQNSYFLDKNKRKTFNYLIGKQSFSLLFFYSYFVKLS